MTICAQLTENASAGVAPALRAVDCLANEATSAAFGRLFGTNGALLPSLTIILTLYIAFFAISLLTGRNRLGISALTPRMITLGLVLTFATSWVAYQGVVWNLAVGAPDEIAGVLMGAKGSATRLFGDRIDIIFAAITDAANNTSVGQGASDVARTTAQGSFSPGNLMWVSALLLLLGTVGVLVTARIALAVLLALGPVFVVFALFPGTRGLTAGWLRGVVMTAVVPLFVVIGGGIMLELLIPIVANLRGGGGIDGRASVALFVVAAVHMALMGMVLKVSGSMVAAWNVFGLSQRDPPIRDALPSGDANRGLTPVAVPPLQLPISKGRSDIVTIQGMMGMHTAETHEPSATHRNTSIAMATQPSSVSTTTLPPRPATRARGVGSRFRSPPKQSREMVR